MTRGNDTPTRAEEGLSEGTQVSGDFEISMYGSKDGWKIESSSSSRNTFSYDF